MKQLLLFVLTLGLSSQKSMRVFVNNAIIDSMSYLDFDLSSTYNSFKHGSTSDQITLDVRLDDADSSRQNFDVFVLQKGPDQECYETAVALQDWTRPCSFLTNPIPAFVNISLDVTSYNYVLFNFQTLQNLNFENIKMYIDNTPFPNGEILNFDPLTVFIMKENIYKTSSDMYTATYALILVFAILLVVIVGISVKYHRVRVQFEADKKTGFKGSSFTGSPIEGEDLPSEADEKRMDELAKELHNKCISQ